MKLFILYLTSFYFFQSVLGFNVNWSVGNITYQNNGGGRYDYRKTQIFEFTPLEESTPTNKSSNPSGVAWTSYRSQGESNPIAFFSYFSNFF